MQVTYGNLDDPRPDAPTPLPGRTGIVAMTFDLAGTPPGPNASRHWAVRSRDNEQWKGDAQRTMTEVIRRAKIHDTPWPAVDITAIFKFAKSGRRDVDNLAASLKPIIDGIVAAGAVADDSYLYVDYVGARVQRTLVPAPLVVITVRRCVHR